MPPLDIPRHRLASQHIARPVFEKPADVVTWLGAVQAQDYLGGLWAVGLRTKNATQDDIERALNHRTIVRTWPMRGTLHFVAASDVRWMLELLTPRIVANSRGRLKQLEIDPPILARSKDVFVSALQGGRQLTRDALYGRLEAAHISTTGGRGLHILSQLAQDGTLCFGAREGRQQTFALLEEWVPGARRMEQEEALAELARRHISSHGPATLHDFTWWSGLTVTDARAGLELSRPVLAQEAIGGQTYWLHPSRALPRAVSPTAYLLPVYDEYTVAYKDRSAVLNPTHARRADSGNGIFRATIVIDGQVVGTWTRSLKKEEAAISLNLFMRLTAAQHRAVAAAARRYGKFLGLPVAPF
jgi:hypothetical protein